MKTFKKASLQHDDDAGNMQAAMQCNAVKDEDACGSAVTEDLVRKHPSECQVVKEEIKRGRSQV